MEEVPPKGAIKALRIDVLPFVGVAPTDAELDAEDGVAEARRSAACLPFFLALRLPSVLPDSGPY